MRDHQAANLACVENNESLIGLAPLVRMIFDGQQLEGVWRGLQGRLERDPEDANALMDMSTILQLHERTDAGLLVQAKALDLCRHYRLPAEAGTTIRLLALMAPGPLMDNAPIDFLLEKSDVAIEMIYLLPDQLELPSLPAHDVLLVAMGQAERNHPLLQRLQEWLRDWPQPVINAPARVMDTTREGAYMRLRDCEGVEMPVSGRIDREVVEQLANRQGNIASFLHGVDFPVIIRPIDSHAGKGLACLTTVEELANYLADSPDSVFHVGRFVDYRSSDGYFRKYRIALVDGKPFAGHMAISEHWIVHYLNAGMGDSEWKRQEEAEFMDKFTQGFAHRHDLAFRSIHEAMGLDYFIIDCAETREGKLLVFEVDTGAIIHDLDSPDVYPYKSVHMQKLFNAFHTMLVSRQMENSS